MQLDAGADGRRVVAVRASETAWRSMQFVGADKHLELAAAPQKPGRG